MSYTTSAFLIYGDFLDLGNEGAPWDQEQYTDPDDPKKYDHIHPRKRAQNYGEESVTSPEPSKAEEHEESNEDEKPDKPWESMLQGESYPFRYWLSDVAPHWEKHIVCLEEGDRTYPVEKPSYCIGIWESLSWTHLGSWNDPPVEIDQIVIKPEWAALLQRFCRELGLPALKKPRWWLLMSGG